MDRTEAKIQTGADAPEIFTSYAHEDDMLREEFMKSLSQLQREHVIGEWHDRRLTGGTEWAGVIDAHLNSASIIVLLVSPDFLASRYCYDTEMKRALERNDAGEARVVPVILRPCDWETAPFGKLTALPKDGKPIVDWKTNDHGFLDVALGLRRVAAELQASRTPDRTGNIAVLRRFDWLKAASALAGAVLFLVAVWMWWLHQNREIENGNSFLDVGRYVSAREPFGSALRWNPLNPKASIGLGIVKLEEIRTDAVGFDRGLKRLLNEAPGNPYLKVLRGDSFLAEGKASEAMQEYGEAVKLRPTLAEAWFRLGSLYDQEGRPGPALSSYQKAVEISPSSPHYVDNLADQYFKHGQYDDAIRSYSSLDGFPLARLEMARIFRLTGDLDRAAESEQQAAEGLGNETPLAAVPENADPWLLEGVIIPGRDQKICYARLSLSASLYLKGDHSGAARYADLANQACGSQYLDVRAVVRSELDRVKSERPELARPADAFSLAFLSGGFKSR